MRTLKVLSAGALIALCALVAMGQFGPNKITTPIQLFSSRFLNAETEPGQRLQLEYVDVDSLKVTDWTEGIGVPRQSAPPNTCNASAMVLQYIDDDDGILYLCSDADGSYNWDAVALDADRDGFTNDIDGTPGTAATGYDTPVSYQMTTSYTGTDVQFGSGTQYYIFTHLSTNFSSNPICVAQAICSSYDADFVASYSTGSGSGWATLVNCKNDRSVESVFPFLEDVDRATAALSNQAPISTTGVITGVTCVKNEDT